MPPMRQVAAPMPEYGWLLASAAEARSLLGLPARQA
jgi:hypothetical protein